MDANNAAIGRLLTATEVAAILNVSRTQAYRLLRGPIPVVRFGGTVRVRMADLERFINAHTEGGA